MWQFVYLHFLDKHFTETNNKFGFTVSLLTQHTWVPVQKSVSKTKKVSNNLTSLQY